MPKRKPTEHKNPKAAEIEKVTVEVEDEFDWCDWKEKKKAAMISVRKDSKINGEDKEITRKKIAAIRAHEPENGNVIVGSIINEKSYYYFAIRLI